MNHRIALLGALALSFLVASPVMAATTTPIAVDGVVAQIGEINTAVLAIGGALLAAAAVAVGIKWAKGSIFS